MGESRGQGEARWDNMQSQPRVSGSNWRLGQARELRHPRKLGASSGVRSRYSCRGPETQHTYDGVLRMWLNIVGCVFKTALRSPRDMCDRVPFLFPRDDIVIFNISRDD